MIRGRSQELEKNIMVLHQGQRKNSIPTIIVKGSRLKFHGTSVMIAKTEKKHIGSQRIDDIRKVGQIWSDGFLYKGIRFREQYISGRVVTFRVNQTFYL